MDILHRLEGSLPDESSHELYCRCLDAAKEISKLRRAIKEALEESGHMNCLEGEDCPFLSIKDAVKILV